MPEIPKENLWWFYTAERTAEVLGSHPSLGLTAAEAGLRLSKDGPNQLPEPKGRPPLKIFLSQFQSLMVVVLIGAAVIAGVLGEWIDSLVIGAIIILNAGLGFIQEFHAERSLAALRQLSAPFSKIIRDGILQSFPSSQIVRGDVVLLEAGDRVPADGRIFENHQGLIQEAALTGESLPVRKASEVITEPKVPLAERRNMVFRGTTLVSGKVKMFVTETGMQTELGKIAGLLNQEESPQTPLQLQLEKLGKWLVAIFLGIVTMVFFMGIFRGYPWMEMLLTSLSLAVAAIPEGLPAVVTIALAIGVRRMARRNALVRRLPSVETLGCTSVICTDKTGTLTKNEMTVRWIYADQKRFQVDGSGYEPAGNFEEAGRRVDPAQILGLKQTLKIGILCNNAELHYKEEKWRITGDPTEAALLVAAQKAGFKKQELEKEDIFLEEFPFDSGRKRMSVLRQSAGKRILYVKGAPDVLLKYSSGIFLNGKIEPMTETHKKEIEKVNDDFASQALRVLAVAFREVPQAEAIHQGVESELIFTGLMAMMDPPRSEAKKAVETCKKSGIRVVMITGDHQKTAAAVAREIGILGKDELALDGADLDALSPEELRKTVTRTAVYARVSAEHKLKIVRAWRQMGKVVAMTGDGVNDAPAIKEAHIGIAMGITGTDVTKEASDMVITDDNFASIVNAVEEGRGIYDNITKFINYLLSSNIAEILVLFFGMLAGMKDARGSVLIPLTAVQLLWMNLVTDGFPAIALALDPLDPQAMNRPPRDPGVPILSVPFLIKIFSMSLLISFGTLAVCFWGIKDSVRHAQTLTLTLLIMLQFLRVEMVRASYHMSLFSNSLLILALAGSLGLQLLIVYVPQLQMLFGTVPLGWDDWGIMTGVVFLVWFAGKIYRSVNEKSRTLGTASYE